jgi:transcriptional regulator with XRE-family HTH domain
MRTAQGMSREALVRRAGIGRIYLNQLEAQKQDSRLSIMARLAKGSK